MKVIKPPSSIASARGPKIFLAGSIEVGAASDWQVEIEKANVNKSVTFFNPRRDDWDNSLVQSIDNDGFYEQVQWELQALEQADLIVFYFDPNTKSPVTMMELGLHIEDKIVVCCPNGFWRKGNVDILCERYNVPTVKSLDQLIEFINYFCICYNAKKV
jgi:hypothetical protein